MARRWKAPRRVNGHVRKPPDEREKKEYTRGMGAGPERLLPHHPGPGCEVRREVFHSRDDDRASYCRPICPARTPKRENVQFFLCAASAEAAGFRPCKRCPPGTAPGMLAWNGTSTTVATALRLVGSGFLDEHSVKQLADRLGLGERHVRRLFVEHVGVAPNAIANPARISPRACSVIRNSPLRTRRSARGSAASASSTTCFEAFSASLRARFESRATRRAAPHPRGAHSRKAPSTSSRCPCRIVRLWPGTSSISFLESKGDFRRGRS